MTNPRDCSNSPYFKQGHHTIPYHTIPGRETSHTSGSLFPPYNKQHGYRETSRDTRSAPAVTEAQRNWAGAAGCQVPSGLGEEELVVVRELRRRRARRQRHAAARAAGGGRESWWCCRAVQRHVRGALHLPCPGGERLLGAQLRPSLHHGPFLQLQHNTSMSLFVNFWPQ